MTKWREPCTSVWSSIALLLGLMVLHGCAGSYEKPNVIIILSDDQGWSDIGYSNPRVYTPNLDRPAAEGARLVRHRERDRF